MKHDSLSYKKIKNTKLLLKISYGLLFIIAGLDKFFHLLADWHEYISPLVLKLLHINSSSLEIIIGSIEILLGITVLTWTRIGAYGIAFWFAIIIANLLSMWSYLDIAARDLVLAIGAIALARLDEIEMKIDDK